MSTIKMIAMTQTTMSIVLMANSARTLRVCDNIMREASSACVDSKADDGFYVHGFVSPKHGVESPATERRDDLARCVGIISLNDPEIPQNSDMV